MTWWLRALLFLSTPRQSLHITAACSSSPRDQTPDSVLRVQAFVRAFTNNNKINMERGERGSLPSRCFHRKKTTINCIAFKRCEREEGEGRETEHVHMHAHITALRRQLGGSASSLLPCVASPQSKTDVKGEVCQPHHSRPWWQNRTEHRGAAAGELLF